MNRLKSFAAACLAAFGLAFALMSAASAQPVPAASPVPAPPEFKNPANVTSPLGTNIGGLADYSGETVFADLIKSARTWVSGNKISGAYDDGRTIAVDGNGNIARLRSDQIARSVILLATGRDRSLRNARFVLKYDGSATLDIFGAWLVESKPGRQVWEIHTPVKSTSEYVMILNVSDLDKTNPLRNLHLTREGRGICRSLPFKEVAAATQCQAGDFVSYEAAADNSEIVFDPVFLNNVKAFRSLRFMDWMQTNESPQVRWADRAHLGDQFWTTPSGVPLEAMVKLTDQVSADPWFCVPHLADDDYIRKFLTAVRNTVSADRKIYIEYSNEVWNGQFGQARYAAAQGEALGLDSDGFTAQLKFYSRQSQRVADLISEVFGSAKGKRVVSVFSAQAVNTYVTDTIMNYGSAATKADAISIAPYFGSAVYDDARAIEYRRLGKDGVFAWLTVGGNALLGEASLPEIRGLVMAQQARAQAYGVPLLAYEAGQHFVGVFGRENDKVLAKLFDDVNRDPRMGAIYTQYLKDWRDVTGQPLWIFTNVARWSKFGSWGTKEYGTQPRIRAVKFGAIQTYIETTPVP
jgi:hypothetical protein